MQSGNLALLNYFLSFSPDVNKLDEDECSPLYYAVNKRDKKAILALVKKGGGVICSSDELFQIIAEALEKDDLGFFELLYHIEFKDTLKEQLNTEGRNCLHMAACLGAKKCLEYLLEKFKFNLKIRDEYGKTYNDYLKNN
jgi:ankyrin repeat protein